MTADWGYFTTDLGDSGTTSSAATASAGGGGSYGSGGGLDAWTSGAVNYMSAQSQNRQNRDNATWAFNSALDASNSAVQRRVADLKAAGLNPMLAYMGQAESPGAPAHAPAVGAGAAGLAGAQQARQVAAETKLKEAEASKAESAAEVDRAMVPKVIQETLTSGASAEQMKQFTKNLYEEQFNIRAMLHKLRQETVTSKSYAEKAQAQKELAEQEEKLRRVQTIVSGLEVAEKLPHAEKAGTWWGKYISPYLHDLSSMSSAAGSARFTIRGIR